MATAAGLAAAAPPRTARPATGEKVRATAARTKKIPEQEMQQHEMQQHETYQEEPTGHQNTRAAAATGGARTPFFYPMRRKTQEGARCLSRQRADRSSIACLNLGLIFLRVCWLAAEGQDNGKRLPTMLVHV